MSTSSVARAHQRNQSINFRPNLEKAMLNMGHFPSEYNLIVLAADLLGAVPDSRTKEPRQIIRELGARYTDCLAAYRIKGAVGVRIPAADNLNPHTPDVARGRDLGRRFHADDWTLAVSRLGDWYHAQTDNDVRGMRLSDALFDLLLAFPAAEVGGKTPRSLAGRLGTAELVAILTDYYGPGSWGHWYPEPVDVDSIDLTRPNLAGGAFGGGAR